jgi:hypothetical protein
MQAQAGSDAISKLPRYGIKVHHNRLNGSFDAKIAQREDGNYVRYDDVVQALQSGEPVVDEWKPKGLTPILADALLAVHSGASLYGIESRLSRLEKMGLVVYRRRKWLLTVHGAEVANKLAEDDLLYATPQPATTKPIAAVKGWFHGECVIQAIDPEAVLPAGMALYAAPQPAAPEGTETPPCDCIENVNGRWVQSCECRNAGDLLSVQDWCTYNNLLSAGKETA